MSYVVIYSDMVGATQALTVEAGSWEEVNDGLVQRLRDSQVVAEGVDKDGLAMFPTMILKADNVETRRVVAYVNESGEEVSGYIDGLN